LKRAAVKFGIGRYLYRQQAIWADYDPSKKRLVKPPQLPREAPQADKPARKPSEPQKPAPARNQAPSAGITAEQWDELRAACEERKIPKRPLLAHFAVSLPRQLPAERFAEALALVKAGDSALLRRD